MCGLCGVLGASAHWSEGVPGSRPPRQERLLRLARINRILRHYRLRLDDVHGAAFVLSTATGRQEMVAGLDSLWVQAARLLGRPLDPLDPALLASLDAENAAGALAS
jgi:hypothetical protein